MTTTDRLAKAAHTLASPLAVESDSAWAVSAENAMVDVLGADRGVLHWCDAERLVSGSITPAELARYETYLPVLEGIGYFERTVHLGVARRCDAYGPHYEAMQRTEYVQEFLPWVRGYDALTLTIAAASGARGVPARASMGGQVQLLIHMATPGRPFEQEHVAIARQLYPAFVAGIAVHRQVGQARADLDGLVDATGGVCALFSVDGRRLHVSRMLEKHLAQEPDRVALADSMDALVQTARRSPSRSASTRWSGARGAYTLSVSRASGMHPVFVVAVEAPSPPPGFLDAGVVADRFGLSPRQAEVALLVAERRSNREIAAALAISVHTARHHVEAVLAALGVSRTDVGRALRTP